MIHMKTKLALFSSKFSIGTKHVKLLLCAWDASIQIGCLAVFIKGVEFSNVTECLKTKVVN